MTDFDRIKKGIIRRHLEELRTLELVEGPLETLPIFADYNDLVTWTNDSRTQINRGIANRVYGGPVGSQIDFNNVFMAFMESAAVYLRDTSEVLRAVTLYRSGNNDDEAINIMDNASRQISAIADMWGMYFVQICDLVTLHPDGHSWMVGPFCGAFIPKDYKTSTKPFIGIAFKGTSATGEIINDLMAAVTVYVKTVLWESQIAQGFFYPLFSTYEKTPSLMPFNMVRQAIQDLANGGTTTMVTHVTGHSLGGAYATLSYAQLCIGSIGTAKALLGDLYTFGAPRVGRGDFAVPFRTAVHSSATAGSPWRIMNNRDPVPKLPASPLWPLSRDPYIHVDSAYKIYPDSPPAAQPSEIGTHPTWPMITAIAPHYTTEYYKSLTYATTQRPPLHPVTSWGILPLPDLTYPGDDLVNKPFWDFEKQDFSFILENHRQYVVGSIKYGSLIGQITALGNVTGKLVGTKRFNFDSAAKLFERKNQCVFKKEAKSQLGVYFIVDDTLAAYASVVSEGSLGHGVEDGTLTRGICLWTFDETEQVANVEKAIADDVASLLIVT